MHLGQRIRAGIALHAAVNIGFALLVVATTDSPGPVFVAPATAVETAAPATTALDSTIAPTPLAPSTELVTPTTAAPTTTTRPTTTATTAAPTTGTVLTTTTTAPVTTTSAPLVGSGERRRLSSTGYCIDGMTASGVPTGPGQAAMNGVPFGSRFVVHDGPYPGTVYEVTDRVAGSSEFDIWFDSCDDAFAYGRRTITVEQVG